MTAPRSTARVVALVCLTVVVLALLILGGLACFAWGRESAQGDQSNQDNEVAGCVSSYRAQIVDLPTVLALRALQQGDERALTAAVNEAKIEQYQQLLALRQTDPGAFLERCAADGRDGG